VGRFHVSEEPLPQLAREQYCRLCFLRPAAPLLVEGEGRIEVHMEGPELLQVLEHGFQDCSRIEGKRERAAAWRPPGGGGTGA